MVLRSHDDRELWNSGNVGASQSLRIENPSAWGRLLRSGGDARRIRA